jgi:Glutathione-dependent formaldehyde-activating enzyme
MKKPSFPLKGGCACGAVRYEIAAPPLAIYACHCTDCQRRTGTAFALNMPVRTSSLRIVTGTPKGLRSASSNGATATSLLELAHLLGDGAACQIELARGMRKAQMAGCHPKSAETIKRRQSMAHVIVQAYTGVSAPNHDR